MTKKKRVALKDPTNPSARSGYLLTRLGIEARSLFKQALAAHRVTLPQYGALMLLAEHGAASQSELAHAVGVDPRNFVPLLDDLEHHGLLQRGLDRVDRRRHTVDLSPAGRRLFASLAKAGVEAENALLAHLGPEDRRTLNALLLKVLRATSRPAGDGTHA